MKILMVEDERYLAEAVARILEKNNYDVDLAFDGEDGLDSALTGVYDMILLDIMLPKLDGVSLLKHLRGDGVSTPVILLTAKGETEDKVLGLDSGADDYLPKPFKTEELLARIRAVSRRKGELLPEGVLAFGDIELNPSKLILSSGDRSYNLTLKEGRLLEYLIANKGTSLSADAIIEKVWGYDSDAEDNHVQVYISFLRKKLARLGSSVKIRNIRNVGYVLAAEGNAKDGRGSAKRSPNG
ncbi:MAG: response regulator transcription factor [Clostridiales Family XIII bacterium]|jgi:DNA-binding response OmpR family regulator|nr:response regulator transcription factor [Clostridiales Family XIII bacterium]